MSVKVYDVPGANLTSGVTTQDFVLNSHPVMVASDTRSFLALLRAMERGGLQQALYLDTESTVGRDRLRCRSNPSSHLDIPYLGTTPYLYRPGAGGEVHRAAVRAGVSAAAGAADRRLSPPGAADATGGRGGLLRLHGPVQSDSERTPIEDAMVEWKENDSPYRAVARIRMPPQRVDDPARLRVCEDTSFNPWHALIEHPAARQHEPGAAGDLPGDDGFP